MNAKIKESLFTSGEAPVDSETVSWPDELKQTVGTLIDLAVRALEANGKKLMLNEVLTGEESAAKLKIPLSSIDELVRRSVLKSASAYVGRRDARTLTKFSSKTAPTIFGASLRTPSHIRSEKSSATAVVHSEQAQGEAPRVNQRYSVLRF